MAGERPRQEAASLASVGIFDHTEDSPSHKILARNSGGKLPETGALKVLTLVSLFRILEVGGFEHLFPLRQGKLHTMLPGKWPWTWKPGTVRIFLGEADVIIWII